MYYICRYLDSIVIALFGRIELLNDYYAQSQTTCFTKIIINAEHGFKNEYISYITSFTFTEMKWNNNLMFITELSVVYSYSFIENVFSY